MYVEFSDVQHLPSIRLYCFKFDGLRPFEYHVLLFVHFLSRSSQYQEISFKIHSKSEIALSYFLQHKLKQLRPKLLVNNSKTIVFHYPYNTCESSVSALTWSPVSRETKSCGKLVISDTESINCAIENRLVRKELMNFNCKTF